MANGVNNRAFDEMETVAADKTAVDLFLMPPEEIQTVTDEDRKTWKNFSNRLGSLDSIQKRQLKDLWIQGGRPTINIQKKGTGGHKGDTNRAWYHTVPTKKGSSSKLHRDEMNIYEHQLVGDFMAEITHARMFSRKENEDAGDWQIRREALNKQVREEEEDFGEDVYGGIRWKTELVENDPTTNTHRFFDQLQEVTRTPEKWFPYRKRSPTYHIGKVDGEEIAMDEEGNVYPHVEIPKRQDFDGGVSIRATKWQQEGTRRAVFDPKTRLGEGGQKLTHEFEAHEVIEDSLWSDYVNRFGKKWDEYGTGWMKQDWRKEHREPFEDLIKQGLVQ